MDLKSLKRCALCREDRPPEAYLKNYHPICIHCTEDSKNRKKYSDQKYVSEKALEVDKIHMDRELEKDLKEVWE